MKFLIDVGVGEKVEEILKSKGYDAKSVLDADPMSDLAILQLASTEKRIVITMDKDFGELVFIPGFIMKAFYYFALRI